MNRHQLQLEPDQALAPTAVETPLVRASLREVLAQYEGAQAASDDGHVLWVYLVTDGNGLWLSVWFDTFGDESRPRIYRRITDVEQLCRRWGFVGWTAIGERLATPNTDIDAL